MSRSRRSFDALENGLASLAPLQPGLAFAAASALGSLRNRLSRRWPSPEQVRALFPHLDRRSAERVSRKIGGFEARNRLLIASLHRTGLDQVRPLIRPCRRLSELRPPLVLGFFHVGCPQALAAAIERLSAPVLLVRQGSPYAPIPPVILATTEGDGQRRAAIFRRSLSHLAGGGFVIVALDVVPGRGFRVPFLGRTIELARGPFALARLAGVPLVPVVARWRRSGIEVEVGEAVAGGLATDPKGMERDLAASAAGWLERYLQESPAELGLGLLRALLAGEPG
ncbi:MAG TPA: hypothetical protein VGS07_24115 [Thermoanaerobaculia bacterium]|nr:hypothetical protein [Thermoanaerobaculia bacterium]